MFFPMSFGAELHQVGDIHARDQQDKYDSAVALVSLLPLLSDRNLREISAVSVARCLGGGGAGKNHGVPAPLMGVSFTCLDRSCSSFIPAHESPIFSPYKSWGWFDRPN
jgi:hypothetical protein